MFYKWVLIISSACLYAIPFLATNHFWWLTFIFLIPLFYASLVYKLSFKEGFVWGFISFTLHEIGIFYSLTCMSAQCSLYFVAGITGLVIYESVYSGLWFWISAQLTRYTQSDIYKILLWIITTWLYFYVIDRFFLWPFGNLEGYFLVHPLLPLAHCSKLLYLMSFMGKIVLTLIFICSAALITLALKAKNIKASISYGILASFPWILSCILSINSISSTPSWLSRISVIKESFYNPTDTAKTFEELRQAIKQVLKNRPHTELIILPESALYLCNLIEFPHLVQLLDEQHLGKPISIIVGALRKENNSIYNSVYLIQNGKIIKWFDKRHSLFITERLPQWAAGTYIEKLFFSNRPCITPAQNKRTPFEISHDMKFIIYICSEIFFNDRPDDNYPDIHIMALCNDTWIEAPYLENLMRLTNKFRAIQWKRDILYISYNSACAFDTKGQQIYSW